MGKKAARYAATNKNLVEHALAPAMRALIATALDGATMTYGEMKGRLESEESFSTIFATRIGFVAGELMNKIQNVKPDAPLLNVLVVNQKDRQPSKGAGSFMAHRFKRPSLATENYKQENPERWASYFQRAAQEVYTYSPEQWSHLYRRVFGDTLSINKIKLEREKRQRGNEDDFGAGGGKYGAGGESEHHKSLRLWVSENPQMLRRSFAGARSETEFSLDSGDRVDAVYHLPDRAVVVEVKSRISNVVDLRRGVYQCIKYRAVKAAMDVHADLHVEAVLVTETEIPGEISSLLKQHNINHVKAPMKRG